MLWNNYIGSQLRYTTGFAGLLYVLLNVPLRPHKKHRDGPGSPVNLKTMASHKPVLPQNNSPRSDMMRTHFEPGNGEALILSYMNLCK